MTSEKEIRALLSEAHAASLKVHAREYRIAMNKADHLIKEMGDGGILRGEWWLISTFESMQDIDELCRKLSLATEMIPGRSQIVPERTHMLRGFYDIFGTLNAKPGEADHIASRIKEAEDMFYRLTGGGRGSEEVYLAQLHYFRGNFAKAEEHARKAMELGHQNEQGLIVIGAAEIMANIAKHTRNDAKWRKAFEEINDIRENGRNETIRRTAEMAFCKQEVSLGILHNIPKWITEGNFGVVPYSQYYRVVEDHLDAGAFPAALMIWIQYHLYTGNYTMTINVTEVVEKVFGLMSVNMEIYTDIFRAGAWSQLGEMEMMESTIEKAMKMIKSDELWLIAAEFVDAFGDVIYRIAEKVDPAAPEKIREIGENFWDKLKPIREHAVKDAPPELSPREQEVANLLMEGKTNEEISEELHISIRTVGTHLENIYRKHNVRRRSQLTEAMRTNAVKLALWTQGNDKK